MKSFFARYGFVFSLAVMAEIAGFALVVLGFMVNMPVAVLKWYGGYTLAVIAIMCAVIIALRVAEKAKEI